MHQLIYELQQLCWHNRDGSYTTQYQRRKMLVQMGHQLLALGYQDLRAVTVSRRDLKQGIGRRHVNKLVALWKEQGISHEVIPNRLAALRWWCEKVNRASVMPRTNAEFRLTPRRRVALVSQAVEVDEAQLVQVTDPYVQMSLRLQAQFGLRREECLKIRVWQADAGDRLVLQGSWCKNGRAREIPAESWAEQREVLEQAKQLVRFKSHSLIPPDLYYYQQRNRYDAAAQQLGVPPLHGLRHHYAIRRYEMLAQMACPVHQGPRRAEMTAMQRARDLAARQQVSHELGHGRLSIVGVYIGSH